MNPFHFLKEKSITLQTHCCIFWWKRQCHRLTRCEKIQTLITENQPACFSNIQKLMYQKETPIKFATICTATNSSLRSFNCFFDNLDLLSVNPCLIQNGCCMTAYATADVPNNLASLLNHRKLCRNCGFPQNCHTRKLGENTVFYGVNCAINSLNTNYYCKRW